MPSVNFSRRVFLSAAAAGLVSLRAGSVYAQEKLALDGPGTRYTPKIAAAFVRRKGDYGILWPGAIYDGETARADYSARMSATAKELGAQLNLRPEPIHSFEEGQKWLEDAKTAKPDGLLVVLLDRQEHAWPVAEKAAESGIPTVIFAPLGTAFTSNTASLAEKEGVLVASTNEFGQAAMGMRMLAAAARLREARFVIIKGDERKERRVEHFGTMLRYIPAASFLELYRNTPDSLEIEAIADEYMKNAERIAGPTRQDVLNGVKSFVVAREFLRREEGDGISMDCLGALGETDVSLPCIAWSRMLDWGIPAACEADVGACITHALVQYLFRKPGFEQDPVPDTAAKCLIGAHCTCPTRLRGFNEPPEPYYLSYHHGKRDAVPVPRWEVGGRVTIADVEEGSPPAMIISTGTVARNMAVPPSGGCVVSVSVRLDHETNLLKYPGFHQVFFYGDHVQDFVDYCKLHRIRPQVV